MKKAASTKFLVDVFLQPKGYLFCFKNVHFSTWLFNYPLTLSSQAAGCNQENETTVVRKLPRDKTSRG